MLPALWLVSTLASTAVYIALGPMGSAAAVVVAVLVCGALAAASSARMNVPLRLAVPVALAGVVTPAAALVAALVISCELGGFCLE